MARKIVAPAAVSATIACLLCHGLAAKFDLSASTLTQRRRRPKPPVTNALFPNHFSPYLQN